MCKKISLEKARKEKEYFCTLREKLCKITEELENVSRSDLNEILVQRKNEAENELNKHLEYKAQDARVRSKCKWYVEGEKNTKMFLGLEKTKCSNKTLKAVLCEDNTIVRENKKILLEQLKYYKKLYAHNPNVAFAYVSLRLHVQNAVSAQPCVGKFQISLVLFNFLHCNFRLWFETP